ncbi:MAG: hypothetical protein HQ518_19925 [Rhodopirellula sp.]|nr:hypothetical protein [Rhodopirellula sp.]
MLAVPPGTQAVRRRLPALFRVPMQNDSVFVVEDKVQGCGEIGFSGSGLDHEEAAGAFFLSVELFDQSFGIGGFRVSGAASQAGIRVDQGSTGELFDARWMQRVVLPVAVSADQIEMLFRDAGFVEPGEELVTLVAEAIEVRVIVELPFVIRASLPRDAIKSWMRT